MLPLARAALVPISYFLRPQTQPTVNFDAIAGKGYAWFVPKTLQT